MHRIFSDGPYQPIACWKTMNALASKPLSLALTLRVNGEAKMGTVWQGVSEY